MFNKFYSVIVPSLAILAISCIGYAKEYRGISEYYVADLTTKEIAVNFARDKAKQNALEQAGTYVTSLSESTNGVLTKDDIHVVTLGVAKLKPKSEQINYTAPDQDGAVTLSYSAVFEIDENEVEKNIKKYQIDNKELKEEKIKNENQQNFIKLLGESYREQQKKLVNEKNIDKTEYNKAIRQIKEGLNAVEYGEIADSYFINLDFKNALLYYEKELEAYNKTGNNSTKEYLNNNKLLAMQSIALCHYELHQNDQAEIILEEALKLAKEDRFKAKLLAQLAKAQMIKGENKDKVINLINQAVAIFPDDKTYFERMDVYFTYKEWRKALEDYDRLSEESKKSPSNAFIAAFCYAEIGDTDKAFQLDALMSKNHKQYESVYGLLYTRLKNFWSYVRGKAYFMRYGKNGSIGDIDNAINEFTEYLNVTPVNDFYVLPAYFHRSVCYGEKKDYKSAYNDAMMALTINPNYEPAKLLLKLIEEKQKERQK